MNLVRFLTASIIMKNGMINNENFDTFNYVCSHLIQFVDCPGGIERKKIISNAVGRKLGVLLNVFWALVSPWENLFYLNYENWQLVSCSRIEVNWCVLLVFRSWRESFQKLTGKFYKWMGGPCCSSQVNCCWFLKVLKFCCHLN